MVGDEGKIGIRVERLKEAKVWMSILGALVVGGLTGYNAVHDSYVGYHDKRYVLRGEALTLAQAEAIESKVDQALLNSKNNAQQMQVMSLQTAQLNSNFKLYSATMLVNQARAELRAVEGAPENTAAYRSLLTTMQDRLAKTEEFKKCILADKDDCNVLLQ